MPEVFEGLEQTLLTFFGVMNDILSTGAGSLTATPPSSIGFPRITP
jgi:hypothetical protein